MDTFAGGAIPQNIPAISAALVARIGGIATDHAGNVYFSLNDPDNMILRIDNTGKLTRIAGTGALGRGGDGGPATNARLYDPQGLAIDLSGNLYIAETGNNRVRKITNGIITTVAGGGSLNGFCDISNTPGQVAAVSVALCGPWDVALDSHGTLYIAEWAGHKVRAVKDGFMTTIAGTGTAGFAGDGGPAQLALLNYPWGVAVDSLDNLYIADAQNHRIRKISNGTITTIAGTGIAGNSGDGGPAAAGQLNSPRHMEFGAAGLFVSEQGNRDIRLIANGIISTAAQSATTAVHAVAANGDLYLALRFPNRIVKISGGTVSPFAGGGSTPGGEGLPQDISLYGPMGLAADAKGNVYIADSGNHVVIKISGGIASVVAGVRGVGGNGNYNGKALLNTPEGVALDTAGNLYIAERYGNAIRKVTPDGIITTVAGNHAQGFGGDNGPATLAFLNAPEGVAVDAGGSLIIADSGNNRVRRVTNGIITTIAGNGSTDYGGDQIAAVNATLSRPIGLAFDSSGALYVSEHDNDRVRKIAGGVITTVAGRLVDGNTWGFSGDGGPAVNAQLNTPWGLSFDPAGSLYFSDGVNRRVRKIGKDGIISTIAGTGNYGFSGDGGYPATQGQMVQATGIAADPGDSGKIYFSDYFNSRVRSLTPITPPTPCSYSVTPSELRADSKGDHFSFSVITGASCAWGITINNIGGFEVPEGGVGSGTFSLIVPSADFIGPSFFPTQMNVGGIAIPTSRVTLSDQTITFPAITTKSIGSGAFQVTATSDSGLAVSFTSAVTSVCTVSDGVVTPVRTGTCSITASQSGNTKYRPAVPVTRTFILTGQAGAPVISSGGIAPLFGRSSTVQPGSWVWIFGTNLATTTANWTGDYPTSLGGVTVTINKKPAFLGYVSPTQINLEAPDDTARGPVEVIVTNELGANVSIINLADFSPSISLLDTKHVAGVILTPDGSGHYQNGTYDIVGPVGAFPYYTRPVKRGETILIYGTGFGPTNPGIPAGKPLDGYALTANPVQVLIFKPITPGPAAQASFPVKASVISSVQTAPGVYQIALTIPDKIEGGDQGLEVQVGGKCFGYGCDADGATEHNLFITVQ